MSWFETQAARLAIGDLLTILLTLSRSTPVETCNTLDRLISLGSLYEPMGSIGGGWVCVCGEGGVPQGVALAV